MVAEHEKTLRPTGETPMDVIKQMDPGWKQGQMNQYLTLHHKLVSRISFESLRRSRMIFCDMLRLKVLISTQAKPNMFA